MGRHAQGRGGRAAAVSSLAVAVAAASLVVLPDGDGTAEAATTASSATTEITLPDPGSTTPRAERPYAAGPSGFLHRSGGVPGMLWTNPADGTTVTVKKADGSVYTPGAGCDVIGAECRTAWYGTDSDLVALPSSLTGNSVTLWDPATDRRTTVTTGDAYDYYRALAGDTVVTSDSLIDIVDGEQRRRPITGAPADIRDKEIVAADPEGVLFERGAALRYVDLESAVNTEVSTATDYPTHFVMSEDRIGWYESGRLHLKSRADLAAPEQVVTVPGPTVLDGKPVLIGDWLLFARDTDTATSKLLAVSLTDGSTRTLLNSAGKYTTPAPGDTALVTGGTGAADWWVQRVSLAADGSPKLEKLHQVPAVENAKTGIALSRGSLRVVEDDPGNDVMDTTSVRTLTTDGGATLSASDAKAGDAIAAKCPYPGAECSALWGNTGTDPEDVHLKTYYDGGSGLADADRLVATLDGWSDSTLAFGTTGGHIVDVSDGYAVYNSGGASPMQYVGEFGYGQQIKRSVRAAALNGSTLWSATTTAGTLTSYSLTERKTLTTVTVPKLGCVPTELQAAGRWVYWSCGTASAGVYDTKAATSTAVTPGDVLLGDGFTVRHDGAAGTLVLTDAVTGTTRVIASGLKDTGLAADRRYRWTVDEYTGLVAWFDAYERTHVATTGITPSAPTAFRTEAGSFVQPTSSEPWTGHWQLSRPATGWSLAFTSVQSGTTGRATRTVTGGATTGEVSATWNGRTASGAYFPNGAFTWTLKATGLGTTTPVTVATGKGYLLRGAPVPHDHVSPDGPDGRGDLLTLNSTGGLTFHSGTGTGGFGTKVSASGWATNIKAVPVADMSGDRCNDLLVRPSDGSLRLYKPACGAAAKPATAYTVVGTGGWNQYDVLTSPGDVSGDGRADLIARNSSTGAIYLYTATSTGKLSARVKLADNWKAYKKIVGTGDLNGDGIGDLLVQDTANTLYRYNGRGNGTFAARAKVFGNWGATYNAVLVVGDLTDDGKADLVSRDSSGTLWRNNGDGKGSFGARSKISTGWSGYKFLV
ncbi:VCBS repeat-containing protein [Streptomyces sp. NPDC052309]|uniref:FG-GAP repeat domain-containing protein n=1 Tax=Streptomyces sp. NPDC052309 TaxID=3155421 RepID=UPI00342E5636